MKTETVIKLSREIEHSRAKFPGNEHKLAALMEEVGELANALLEGRPRSVQAEALQVACVAIRIFEEGDSDFPFSVPGFKSASTDQ